MMMETRSARSALLTGQILQADGLFVLIASLSDARTILRLCTAVSKAYSEHRSRLAVTQVLPKDPRRTKPVGDERWADVLRERVALDLPLKFNVVHPCCAPGGSATVTNPGNPNRNVPEEEKDWTFDGLLAGGICAGPQVMREGIHRAVLTYDYGEYDAEYTCCTFGIVSPDQVSKHPYTAKRSDFDDYWDREGLVNRGFDGGYELDTGRIGMELNLNKRTLTVFELNDNGEWTKPEGTIMMGYVGVRGLPVCGEYEPKLLSGTKVADDDGDDDDDDGIRRPEMFKVGEPPFCWAAESCMVGDEFTIKRRLEPFM